VLTNAGIPVLVGKLFNVKIAFNPLFVNASSMLVVNMPSELFVNAFSELFANSPSPLFVNALFVDMPSPSFANVFNMLLVNAFSELLVNIPSPLFVVIDAPRPLPINASIAWLSTPAVPRSNLLSANLVIFVVALVKV
jgi:hypothetical protein